MNQPTSSLFRGLALLQYVAAAERGLSLMELANAIGLPKPTVHRIALSLEAEGFLQRGPDKRFVVGVHLKDLALSVLSNGTVGAPRHAVLQALSAEIGETCNCTMLDGDHTVYFDRVECNWPIKVNLTPGSHLPLHATASGKLFLAFMRARERQRILRAAPLTQNTPYTLTDPAALEAELKAIRASGVGYDNEEFLEGMVAVAVPVFDQDGRICFTVAAHALTTRKQLSDLIQFIPALRRAADELADYYCRKDDE